MPKDPGRNPTTEETRRTMSPNGPVRTATRAVVRARTALLSLLWSILPARDENISPAFIVMAYPHREPRAAAMRSRRNASEAIPDTESPAISPITSTVPDLPLPETDRVTSDSTAVTEPMDATVAMNLSGRFSGMKQADIEAPTVDVIPGNHPATHPISTPFRPAEATSGSRRSSFCAGTLPPAAVRSTGTPNSPDSMGNIRVPSPAIPVEGMGRNITATPTAPESRNATVPARPEPLRNWIISRTTAAPMTTRGVALASMPSSPQDMASWRGTERRIAAEVPTTLPTAAARTASMPLP